MPAEQETMTKQLRRNRSPAFTAKVAMAPVKGEKTLADLAQQSDVTRTRSHLARPAAGSGGRFFRVGWP
jgi:hypothetical protein